MKTITKNEKGDIIREVEYDGEGEDIIIVLYGAVTDAQVDAWKGLHGYVHEIQVGDKVCYLKPIDLATLRLANTHLVKDITKYAETIAVNSWLGGDKAIYECAEYIMSFADEVAKILNDKTAFYVKR